MHCRYDFQAEGGEEMSVARGEHVWTIAAGGGEQDDPGWLRVVNAAGAVGIVPETYVRLT